MAAEKGSTEKYFFTDESMSEPDSAEPVNPLYSVALSKSDHSSLGRQRTSGTADQAANESTQAVTSVVSINPDDTSSTVRPSDIGKTGVSTSGSLPSMSALQISRPPQSSAVSEEQQQSTTVKAQPPPAVPVRLVRAPSSVRPATNIPQVNCPEKIVICLDISKEMEKKSFILRQGDKKTPIDLVTRALSIFLQTKRSLNSRHEFAVMFLDNSAQWVCDLTGDPKRIMTFLDEMKSCVEVESCDLSTMFNEIACHILPPEVPPGIVPPYIIRVILIYGRSYCEPSLGITKSVFQQLCNLDVKGNSYILEASKNPTKVFDCIAQLLAHPLQRPLQHDLNYSLVANGSLTNVDSKS